MYFEGGNACFRAFILEMLCAICWFNLAYKSKITSASGIVKGYYCKNIWNCATVQF